MGCEGFRTCGCCGEVLQGKEGLGRCTSQLGVYTVLDNAKAMADKQEGYTVYDWNGKVVYDVEPAGVGRDSDDCRFICFFGTFEN